MCCIVLYSVFYSIIGAKGPPEFLGVSSKSLWPGASPGPAPPQLAPGVDLLTSGAPLVWPRQVRPGLFDGLSLSFNFSLFNFGMIKKYLVRCSLSLWQRRRACSSPGAATRTRSGSRPS